MRNRPGYGISVVVDVDLVLPISKMGVYEHKGKPTTISVWRLKKDVEHALFSLPNAKRCPRQIRLNGRKVRLISICTDGTARFELL